jgi:Domain of Unknown Function (DUF748)
MNFKNASPKRKQLVWIFSIIILTLIIVRIALPFIVLHFANKNLANIKGYYGHIVDIDIALIQGAYKIDSVFLNKKDSITQIQTPFFSAKSIDLSVEWKAAFKGSLVGELIFQNPTLLFTKDKVEPKELQKDSTSFKKLLDDFMPLQVNRFEIKNGTIRYKDKGSKPAVDIEMTDAYVLAQNLRNSYDSTTLLPAKIKGSANTYDGTLSFNVNLNPLAESPTFDMNTEIKNTNLTKLNDFFQAYANIDVNSGTFGMYAEAAAKDGKFIGYIKPFIKDLDVLGKEDKDDKLGKKIWEGFAGGVGQIFKNQSKDQLATKIPFEGTINAPNTNVWSAISSILGNAFIQALQPAVDDEINITSAVNAKKKKKTFFQKIFTKKNKDKTN